MDAVECRAYLQAAVDSRATDGREAELNAALGLPAAGVLPWQALERRADATTTPPADANINQQSLLQRVFARTTAGFLGIGMPMPGVGEPSYPAFSTGATGEQLDEGASGSALALAEGDPPLR